MFHSTVWIVSEQMLVILSTNPTNANFVYQRDNMVSVQNFCIPSTKHGVWDTKFLQGGFVLELDYK